MVQKAFLPFLLISFSFSLFCAPVSRGVLDLRSAPLHNSEVFLDGDWEFYWGELLSPEQYEQVDHRDYFYFPAIWGETPTSYGVAQSSIGYGTYVLNIYLPKERPPLSMSIKHVYTAATIFINGKNVDFGGNAAISKEEDEPKWVPQLINVPDADTVQIILQISNFEHRKGGARESIILGETHMMQKATNQYLAYDLVLSGILIMAGLFFLALYLFGLSEKPALYFSLFCLSFVYRIIGADDYTLHVIYPDVPWLFYLRVEYLSLFIPPIFFALYTHKLFQFRYRFNPFYFFSALSGIFALITIVSPPWVFTFLVEPYLILLLLAIALAGVTYYRAYKVRMPGSQYAILSALIVIGVFLYNIILYLGAVQEIEFVTFLGYLNFFFFQSLILFYIFTNSLKEAKENAEKAARTKSDFLSMMSHEIRTPMNAVVGLSNYLIEDKPKKNQITTLQTLKFSAQNLMVIINDILDFSKIEANKIQFNNTEENIRDLIESIRKMFEPIAHQKVLDLSFECDPEIPEILICDPTRTSQILSNLISNAIKFTEIGRIIVKLELVKKEEHNVEVLFSVEDTGIGIEKSQQNDVFESFKQASAYTSRKYGGTGLGLAITQRLLILQGSKLHLISEVGKGSKFYWTQNLEYTQSAVEIESEKPRENQTLKLRLLVVEDNEINVLVLSKYLEKWGVNFSVAKNGQEGVMAVKSNDFDLVLMDIQMPVMDGYAAAKSIRNLGYTLPIIALTASVINIDLEHVQKAGMNDYLTKPFDPEVLFEKIKYFGQTKN